MVDEGQSELNALRARVYGRTGPDHDDVIRLRQLENGGAADTTAQPPPATAASPSAPDSITVLPPATQGAPPASRENRRRGILVATVTVVAVGCFVAGMLAGALPPSAERASATATTVRSDLMAAFPEEFTPSYLRVATWWKWDPGFLYFGGSVDGAAIWVGTLGEFSEVCLVFDESTSATILCNPTGDYPSSFEWIKSSDPSPGTYRLTLEQTGDLQWTFEPAA